MVDEHSEVIYFCLVDRALFQVSKEIVIPELLKDFFHLGLMFSKRTFGEDHDVVNVDNDHGLHVHKQLIHHRLKGGRGIAKTKEHYCWLERTTVADKGSFPSISFLDANIVITPLKIYLHKILRSLELVDELGNERKGVVVSNHMFI